MLNIISMMNIYFMPVIDVKCHFSDNLEFSRQAFKSYAVLTIAFVIDFHLIYYISMLSINLYF